VKVFRTIRPLSADDLVRGQFRGYRKEKGVAADSTVETFAAARLHIDSWRWDGVPFFIRAGKCLGTTTTEVLVTLRRPPLSRLSPQDTNYVLFQLSPQVKIAIGARVKRPIIAAVVAVLAFAAILWMNAGNTSGKFTNLLLFIGYWIAPFCAIVLIDWHYDKDKYTPGFLRIALNFRNLRNGWAAIAAFLVGFAAMVPFMDTSIIVGPVAKALDGADLAFYVGFVVAGVLYYILRKSVRDPAPVHVAEASVGLAGQAAAPGGHKE